jgi:hemoglobin-like flavoprotein
MIKKKLPNSFIIAVYNSLPILDKAGRIFAEKFYDKLLEGESPKKSFDEAKKKVRRSERTYVCCC